MRFLGIRDDFRARAEYIISNGFAGLPVEDYGQNDAAACRMVDDPQSETRKILASQGP
jgi:hypothetical protein